MQIINKIFKVVLILLVFSGQAMAAADLNSCDMDMQMSQMPNDQQSDQHDGQKAMDCCGDDKGCIMDCSLSIVLILDELDAFQAPQISSEKITLTPKDATSRSFTSPFRPPIT